MSDIHGNIAALEAVFDRLDEMQISHVICLGDTAGYYDRINECCAVLRHREVTSIMGNHDQYLATDAICPRSRSATRCLEYQAGVIEASHLDWLRTRPVSAQIEETLQIVHGGWNDLLEEYMQPSEEYFSGIPGQFFASGHTHLPTVWSNGEKTYCNPGSVGQPRDGDPRASFAVWDRQSFEIHRVAYDVAATQHSMRQAGFESYYFDNLSHGLPIGAVPSSDDRGRQPE